MVGNCLFCIWTKGVSIPPNPTCSTPTSYPACISLPLGEVWFPWQPHPPGNERRRKWRRSVESECSQTSRSLKTSVSGFLKDLWSVTVTQRVIMIDVESQKRTLMQHTQHVTHGFVFAAAIGAPNQLWMFLLTRLMCRVLCAIELHHQQRASLLHCETQ